MKKIILVMNILNYVLCDFLELQLTALRFVDPLYWLQILARHKNWRKTDRFLRWFTWDIDVKGPQRDVVRRLKLDYVDDGFLHGLVMVPILTFLTFIIKGIFNIEGHGLLIFYILFIMMFILSTICLTRKNRSVRYMRVFEKRYRQRLPVWRRYTILFIASEIIVMLLIFCK